MLGKVLYAFVGMNCEFHRIKQDVHTAAKVIMGRAVFKKISGDRQSSSRKSSLFENVRERHRIMRKTMHTGANNLSLTRTKTVK